MPTYVHTPDAPKPFSKYSQAVEIAPGPGFYTSRVRSA